MPTYNTICLIVAAGSGERFAAELGIKYPLPKQYLPLAGTPVLRHSCLAFINHPQIDKVLVVHNDAHKELYEQAVGDLPLLAPVSGGGTRQESVFNGLQAIKKYNPQKVLIHDAARPLVSARIISDIINKLDTESAVIPAIPVTDTLKQCENGKIIKTVPRENLFGAQTPQGFIFRDVIKNQESRMQELREKESLILDSNFPDSNLTDDASLFEQFNKEVCIIPGSKLNMKITTVEDLKIVEALLALKTR